MKTITLDDLTDAAQHLATSKKGRDALRRVRDWLRASGLSLDMQNKEAVFTLLDGAWGAYAGSALDAIDEALDG